MIPLRLTQSLENYRDHHRETGGFLRSVLSGELFTAVLRADPDSQAALSQLTLWIMREMPGGSWGSRDKVEAWLEARP